jgi:hypothetical protein
MQELINKLNELPIIRGADKYNNQISKCITELKILDKMLNGSN